MVKDNGSTKKKSQAIVMTRQPIFDRKKEVFAYELLFKSNLQQSLENRANPIPNTSKKNTPTSTGAIDSIFINGLKRLSKGKKAVINFDRDMLINKLPMVFPNELLGVEVTEESSTDNTLSQTIKKLKDKGYLLIVNNHLFNRGDLSLVKMADIVGVDFRSPGLQKRFSIFDNDPSRPRFMARSVETPSDYDTALNKGYQYFQGSFFNSVDLISIRSIPGYKMNLMRILKEINKPLVEFECIEEILKKDVSITYKLLRFINSSSFGFKTTVQSIHHALTLLGEAEVKKLLSLIVLSSVGTDKPQELVQCTLIRAKFSESIARELNYQNEVNNFFLMGMFSMVDAFLGRPMAEILEDLPLTPEVKASLLGTSNHYRDVLELVIDYENGNWEFFDRMAKKLKIEAHCVSDLYLDATEWGKLL